MTIILTIAFIVAALYLSRLTKKVCVHPYYALDLSEEKPWCGNCKKYLEVK